MNSAARRLASSKSATAMASAAVTAASAAAALAPFVMSLVCLPAKGASRNFSMEKARPVAGHDCHDLLGHYSSFTAFRRSFD